MRNLDNLSYQLALWRLPGIGPKLFNQIQTKFPQLQEFFELSVPKLKACGFHDGLIESLESVDWLGVDNDLKWAEQPQHQIITPAHSHYPRLLREIDSAPPLLFIIGDSSLLSRAQIAMVGSRNPTPSGADTAFHFAKHLVQAGLVITSGLALGIDAASHAGALAGSGKTIAVMGTGPEQIYPARHRGLANKIIEQGVLITEFPTGIIPSANNFPRRNRIISGLSLGVLVVEAAFKSGSLITAHCALDQGREVFAIPGSIHNPLARGCHALLRQGAKLVETAQDILDEIGALQQLTLDQQVPETSSTLSSDQQRLLSCLGFESTAVDILIQRSGLTAEAVSSILLLLELQGYVSAVPGGYVKMRV